MSFSELSPDIRGIIINEAISRTSYLRLNTSNDVNDKKSLELAETLLETPDEKLVDAVWGAYNKLKMTYNILRGKAVYFSGADPYLMAYDIIWGRMYVWLYFPKHDDPLWTEHLFPLMKEHKMPPEILEDVNSCEKFIDGYIEKKQRFHSALQQKNNSPKPEQTLHDGGISPFHIAEGSKTDVMKVLFYLYDQNVFADENGQPLKRRKSQFMKAIGTFLNSDFDNYSQRINAAAAEPNFPDILERMLKDAQQKYADEYK